jgi:hypothetical protein
LGWAPDQLSDAKNMGSIPEPGEGSGEIRHFGDTINPVRGGPCRRTRFRKKANSRDADVK